MFPKYYNNNNNTLSTHRPTQKVATWHNGKRAFQSSTTTSGLVTLFPRSSTKKFPEKSVQKILEHP